MRGKGLQALIYGYVSNSSYAQTKDIWLQSAMEGQNDFLTITGIAEPTRGEFRPTPTEGIFPKPGLS